MSSSLSNPSVRELLTPVLANLYMLYMHVQIVNNALVLWVMPNARVSVPPRVKHLYISIAFFDVIAVTVKDLVYYYVEDGLYYTTNGAFWVLVC